MSFAFFPWYTGDYLRDTRHLSPMKHGIYMLLLAHCWDQKGPAPLDEQECAGIANCRSHDEIDALRYILSRYFVRMEDGHYNARIQREIDRANAISGARSEAGRKGYQAKAQAIAKQVLSKSQASATTPTPTPTPTTTTTPTPKENNTEHSGHGSGASKPAPGAFEVFWRAYPRKIGKDAAAKAFAKRHVDPELLAVMLAAIDRQRGTEQWRKDDGQFIPHPATWLNGGRWHDEVESQPRGPGPSGMTRVAL